MATNTEKEKLSNAIKCGLCKCGDIGDPVHCCPYSQDIEGDYDYKCNCCKECVSNCASDI
jgi:hypothetical protein